MSSSLAAALLLAVLGALSGLLVPALIRWIPEPEPEPEAETEPEPGDGQGSSHERDEADTTAPPEEPAPPPPPKELYADIGALPGLAWKTSLATAVVGAVLGWAVGLETPLLFLAYLAPVGVALSVVDWRTRLLPRLVVRIATLVALLLVVAVGLATGETDALVRALVGMVAVRSFFWVLWSVTSAGMGFGDVRLAALVGLVLGWVGWGALAIGVWAGFVLFSLPGLLLAMARRDRSLLRKPFPYGPFMLLGALAGLVWGTALAARIWG